MTPSLVRLSTGEDILAVIEFTISGHGINSDSVYTLKKAMRLFAQPDPSGKVQVGFADFPPFGSGDSVEIMGRHIMFIVDADPRLIQSYTQATSSIITPASSGIKLL